MDVHQPANPKAVMIILLSVLTLGGCGGERQAAEGGAAAGERARPLTVKGSDTMVILGQRIAEEYMKTNPGTVVQVNGGGSGTGIAALINGTVDLAQSSRAMSDEEKASVRQNRGAAVVETPVALDSLAVFVHASNPVRSLTMDQIKQIYQGRITRWNQIGGPNETIVLYGRENSSGTYDYFREHVLNEEDFAPRVQTLAGTAAVINAVARDRNSIGYGGIAYASEVRPLEIAAEGKAAVAPSEQTVADSTYPLARHLYFYHLEGAPERVTDFVEYTLSAEGQALVAGVGYFPLTQGGATGGASEGVASSETSGANAP
ncbi:MAG TPA: phosphate ABC transporter substrate-binding protein [Thermoanaerobaculia bacterium]|nr:phosphate ABC transporter substrate-binding protein [Thermoanaerobaculia bacterium]